MPLESSLVRAKNHQPKLITCSITDQLLQNLPISVVFFYQKSIDYAVLVNALQTVLSDFPIFSGVLKKVNYNLCIDCNNQGVLFLISHENQTINQILKELPKIQKDNKERLVHEINPKTAIADQSPLLTIQLTYFACGGMTLGACWHHSIGDMHTFMQLMKAWSNAAEKKDYALPLIIEERDAYLAENLEKNQNTKPSVRYINTIETFKLIVYLLFTAYKKQSLQFYFSETELNAMKQDFLATTNQDLSRNDVLCAHVFSIISDLDYPRQERILSIAINHRLRLGLPLSISGNYISMINLLIQSKVSAFQLAQDLRKAISDFKEKHMSFFATQEYIQSKGGVKKISRFIALGIDPINRSLFVTNWSNFGVYDLTFGQVRPFYFTPFSDPPFPWITVITEGFDQVGLVYSVVLPNRLANKLREPDNLRKIHHYRDPNEMLSEQVRQSNLFL